MKPNIVIVHPPQWEPDPAIESFFEKLCETHYVYVIRPGSEFRDDSPAGVRFLNHTPERLPGFAEVETSIAIADGTILAHLKEAYPSARHTLWDPAGNSQFPNAFLSSTRAGRRSPEMVPAERLTHAV